MSKQFIPIHRYFVLCKCYFISFSFYNELTISQFSCKMQYRKQQWHLCVSSGQRISLLNHTMLYYEFLWLVTDFGFSFVMKQKKRQHISSHAVYIPSESVIFGHSIYLNWMLSVFFILLLLFVCFISS